MPDDTEFTCSVEVTTQTSYLIKLSEQDAKALSRVLIRTIQDDSVLYGTDRTLCNQLIDSLPVY
jgi:hypothetical protein